MQCEDLSHTPIKRKFHPAIWHSARNFTLHEVNLPNISSGDRNERDFSTMKGHWHWTWFAPLGITSCRHSVMYSLTMLTRRPVLGGTDNMRSEEHTSELQ